MKSNLLVICPKYPPLKDGLSGHTYQLCKELSNTYHVDLLTSKTTPMQSESHVRIFPSVEKWNYTKLKQAFLELSQNFECIIIQYVPSLYGPKGGVNFSILLFFLWLRFIKKENTSFIFHELYYPLQLNWKAVVLHHIHKFMLFFSILSAKQAFYSTEKYLTSGKGFSLSKRKHFHLPVGASIEIPSKSRFSGEESEKRDRYVLFGGFHPSKRYDLIFRVFAECARHSKPQLHIIGTTKEELAKQTKLPDNFDTFAICHGKIEDEEVIKIFDRSAYLIAYFSDGMSTRRSSVISALACSLPIISTKTKDTEKLFNDNKDILLFETEEKLFEAELTKFLQSPYQSNSKDIGIFYEQNFSWKKIVKILISRSLSSF